MFNKKDPLVDSVKQVMDRNTVLRETEEFVNNAFGVTSRKALPHESQRDYDAALQEAQKVALNEGLSALQEVSKELLGRYTKKANRLMSRDSFEMGKYQGDYEKGKNNNPSEREAERSRQKTWKKRKPGIIKAIDKISGKAKVAATNEETERLDEISRERLVKYAKRANVQSDTTGYAKGYFTSKGYPESKKKNEIKARKRSYGFDKAIDKLTGKAKVAATNEGLEEMKLIQSHASPDGKKVAKVYRNKEWDEYVVKHHVDGKHQKKADYHTSDKEDAHGTANHFIKEDDAKIEAALRKHRKHVFDPDDKKADRHERALKRIKNTPTFKKYAKKIDDKHRHIESEKLLRRWAEDVNSEPVVVKENSSLIRNIVEERKRTMKVADAFMSGRKAKEKTLATDGRQVTYHGNVIAKHHDNGEVHVTTAGYGHSPSTRGHVNGILRRLGAETLSQKKGKLMHGKNEIGSNDWIKLKKNMSEDASLEESSHGKLSAYNKKAFDQLKNEIIPKYQSAKKSGDGEGKKKLGDLMNKRAAGVKLSVQKLTKKTPNKKSSPRVLAVNEGDSVSVLDTGNRQERKYDNVSHNKRNKIIKQAVRSGIKRYGGKETKGNWGSKGGDFPKNYVTATWKPNLKEDSLEENRVETLKGRIKKANKEIKHIDKPTVPGEVWRRLKGTVKHTRNWDKDKAGWENVKKKSQGELKNRRKQKELQLDEISKAKAAHYIKMASIKGSGDNFRYGVGLGRSVAGQTVDSKQQMKHHDNSNKRLDGIMLAVDKLSGKGAKVKATIKEAKKKMDRHDARSILNSHGGDVDFHTLSHSDADSLANKAKEYGYRKSKSSPGSTGRAFHSYVRKKAMQKESAESLGESTDPNHHAKNKFHRVLDKNGFSHTESRNEEAHGHTFTKHIYKNKDNDHVVVTKHHKSGDTYWIHRYKQPNGIWAPSHGTTKPQLDKTLVGHYGPKEGRYRHVKGDRP